MQVVVYAMPEQPNICPVRAMASFLALRKRYLRVPALKTNTARLFVHFKRGRQLSSPMVTARIR